MSDSNADAERNDSPATDNHPALLDCCGGLNNVDYSKMDLTLMEAFIKHINVYDSRLCIAVIAILFNPLFWNVYDSGNEGPGQVGGDGEDGGFLRWDSSYGVWYPSRSEQLPRSGIHRNLPSGASPVGLILTAIVAVAYKVAISFEGPFTEQIYRERSLRHKRE
uniref:Phosphatidylethanolamine N-methyltransferase n=1 Tax=Oreochromis aureus TaxID=47969 RepID=A0AAZ1XLT9_OREAU